MLFDLRSPGRRRVIRISYAILAVLFGGGFLFFFTGSEIGGGQSVFEAVGIGGSSNGDSGFEDQIDEAEQRLEQNPADTAALAELVQLRYQVGTNQIEVDEETGAQSLTAEGEEQLRRGADAWTRLQQVSKGKVPTGVASLAVQTFAILADTSLAAAAEASSGDEAISEADDAIATWGAAAQAQRILAEAQGSADAYRFLAFYLYRAGEFAAADQAAQQALAQAKSAERSELEQELKQSEQEGRQLHREIDRVRKQLQQAGAEGNPLEDLGGGLGGGGLGGGGPSAP